MNRSTLARRYAPLVALAAVQLLIIATVPSTAVKQVAAQVTAGEGTATTGGSTSGGQAGVSAGSGATGQTTTAGGGPSTSGSGASTDLSGGNPGAGGSEAASGTTGSETGGSGASGPSGTPVSAPPGVTGDTSHCSGGREFSASVAYFAPPCVPGTPGAADPNNGGATASGVTADQINVLDYNGDPGAEVDAIEQAEGLYESFADAGVLDKAYANFINKEYVLYGRRLHIITYQGQCQVVPPDTNCLIPEMDKIASQYHPYIVYWNTTLCSARFAELARDHVISVGGLGFSDPFVNANAPYFYSESESSTRIEEAFAEFYCKQLAKSPVAFAGTGNVAQRFDGRPRTLGILSTNDPDNENTVTNVLVPLLKRDCGVDVNHLYFYSQNINTAAQQTTAGIARMDTSKNPATTVLCLCDSVAPEFLYEGEKLENYYPENVIASDQGMDLDKAAQAYSGGIACIGGHPCAFDVAFGVGPDGPEQPAANDEGDRIFHLGGGNKLPVDPTINQAVVQAFVMMANLIENTGPDLTPANMQARAPAMGSVGGGSTGQALLQFLPGDYSWQQDARVEYWDPNRVSSYNGVKGTFVTIEGTRFNLGQYPTLNEPPIPEPPPRMTAIVKAAKADTRLGRTGRMVALGVGFLIAVQFAFGLSLNYFVDGVVLGSLYGLIGVALILIYRTNRIINFAAGAIGAVPAIFALVLDAHDNVSYVVVLPVALIGGALFGAAADVFVMRRFARSPRLIVTVVTIGLSQTLAIIGYFTPIWLGVKANLPPNVPTPWQHSVLWRNSRGQPIIGGNQMAAIVTVVVLSVALALFLRYTRVGIAIRAASENADRAALLGIPVLLVGTAAWAVAGVLSSMAVYIQAPLVGLPQDVTLGFDTLLYGLTAAVVARMERIGLTLAAGMGIGVIVFGSVAKTGDSNLASAIMVPIILVALLTQRGLISRALDAGTSSWESVKQFRPIPLELRGTSEVRIAKGGLLAAVTALAIAAPFIVHSPDLPELVFVPIYGIIAVSLVVLTGWAGQVSLGQFGLVGAGALAAGGIIARHNIDFFAALGIGIAAGVVVALIIGLPAVRIQGLYLAVTTLAFGYAMQGYFLNEHYWIGRHLLPSDLTADVNRPVLLGRINLENNRSFYYVCLTLLVLTMAAAYSFRRNRSGRVLIASRDNQRAAPAYGINLVRTRLAAFAVSGGMAGMAGVLIVYLQHQVVSASFGVLPSVLVFLATVVGGLTSVGFAVAGAAIFEFTQLFGPRYYHVLGQHIITIIPLLITGPLLIVNLYFYPGGSAQAGFGQRDTFLRWVARRRDILVPSLVADKLVTDETDHTEDTIIEQAERHVEQAEAVSEATVTCPVCGDVLALAVAAEHAHLKGGSTPVRARR